jgi:hypothetical protein
MKPNNRALVAAVLSAAMAWVLILAVAPGVHTHIHSDANQVEHVCAVTLVSAGSVESGPPPVSAAAIDSQSSEAPVLSSTWVQSLVLIAHVFAHAPPAFSLAL